MYTLKIWLNTGIYLMLNVGGGIETDFSPLLLEYLQYIHLENKTLEYIRVLQ